MNDRLEHLLRDPRAHGDAPDAEDVRAWGEQALLRWHSESAESAPVRRFDWQAIAAGLGLLSAAAALAPVVVDLAARAWAALDPGRLRLADVETSVGAVSEAFAGASPLLFAGVALLIFVSVPQTRSLLGRLLDA